MEYLRKAAHTISHARPTTVKRMALLCDLCLAEAERALAAGEDTAQAIVNKTVELNNTRSSAWRRSVSTLSICSPRTAR